MHYNWTKKCNKRIKSNQEFHLKLFCNWICITVRGLYKILRKIILVWFQLLLRPRQIEAAVDESLILLLHNELCCHKAHLSVFEMQSMFLISWWIGAYKEVSAADVGQLSDLSVSGFVSVSSVWVQNQKLFRKYFQMGFFFFFLTKTCSCLCHLGICALMQMGKAAPTYYIHTLLPLLVCCLSTAHVHQMQEKTDERE